MANDKRFVTKNGLTTQNIAFVDSITNVQNTITLDMFSNDALSFSGESGQLFSITDSMEGTIFSVNDISGIPSIEVTDDGTIRLAEYSGNVGIGTATPTDKLHIAKSGGADFFRTERTDIAAYFTIDHDSLFTNFDTNQRYVFKQGGTEVVRINLGGNVGIGTTAPSQKLHVVGTGYATGDFRAPIFYDSADTNYYVDPNSVSVLNTVQATNEFTSYNTTLSSGTPVGGIPGGASDSADVINIGVSSYNAGFIKFNSATVGLNDSKAWIGAVYNSNYSQNLHFYSSRKANLAYGNVSALNMILEQDAIRFYTAPAGNNDSSQRMIINSSGNVGIGTSSPIDLLHVNGNIFALKLYNGSTNNSAGITFPSSTTRIDGYSGITFHASATTVGSQTERMRITQAGNVGIGTSAPDSMLTLKGTTPYIRIERGGVPTWEIRNNFPTTEYGFSLVNVTESITPLFVSSNATGHIGIGTTSPDAKLQILGAANTLYFKASGDDADGGRALEFTSFSSGGSVGAGHNINAKSVQGVISFSTASSERIRITSAGDVGIGTSTPYKKLEVTGDIQLDAENANLWLKSGVGGTNGFINWTFNTDSTVYAKLGIDYDTRSSNGFYIDSGYPITLDATSSNNKAIGFSINGVEKMRMDGNGNLGLGVTPSAWANSFKVAQLGAGGYISGRTNTDEVYVGTNSYFDITDNRWEYIANDVATQYYQDSGTHVWRIAPSGTAGNAITFTQAMTLNASGNLGIGTSSPATKLHISGSSPIIRLSDTDGGGEYSQISGDNLSGSLSIQADEGNSASNSIIAFRVDASEKVRITSAGNVGIGTSTPTHPFEVGDLVDGTINPVAKFGGNRPFYIQAGMGGNEVYNSGIGFSAYYDTSTNMNFVLPASRNTNGGAGISSSYNGDLDFYTYNAGDTNASTIALATARRVRITNTGNVGIGTTTPNGKLHVVSNVARIQTWQTTNSSGGYAEFYNGSISPLFIGYGSTLATGTSINNGVIRYDGSNNLLIARNGTETARFDSNGNFGIGTSAPEAKLHVIGTTRPLIIGSDNATNIAKFYNSATGSGTYNGFDIVVDSTNGSTLKSYGSSLSFSTSTTNGVNATKRVTITDNGDLVPGADATYNLGSPTLRWNNMYTTDLHLSNEAKETGNSVDGTKGNWTIQEGEQHLYIINNKNGKKYKFALQEIE